MKIFLVGGVVGILSAVSAFLFYIPSLRISNISISGLNSDDEVELRAEVISAISARKYLIIPEDHLIFFNKERVKSLLAKKFRVKDYELETDFPSSLKILVTERTTWAVWCPANLVTKPPSGGLVTCLLVDKDGIAFSESLGFSGTAILKIIDAREEDFLGKNILPEESFKKISYIIENVPIKAGEEIGTINIKSSGKTYLLYVKSGWYMLIDDETDAERALENLSLALDSEIKEKRKNLEYIDLRFSDKVFYRYKN